MGIYAGWVKAQFGGRQEKAVKANAGDVIIVPAGVAHKNLDQSAERPQADERIKKVLLPLIDPVFGTKGALRRLWY